MRLARAVVVALVAVFAVGCAGQVRASVAAGVAGPQLPIIGRCPVGRLLAGDLAAGKRRLSGRSWFAEHTSCGSRDGFLSR